MNRKTSVDSFMPPCEIANARGLVGASDAQFISAGLHTLDIK